MKKSMSMTAMILAVLGLLLSASLQARGYDQNDIEIDVVADDRGVLRQYPAGWKRNSERSYIVARDSERYSVRIRNNTNHRVGVVIAVDGRNIISGKKSYLKSKERMYILRPWQTARYEGWRTAKNRINRFYFTGMDDSYAAAWDDYSAMGVIAVAVFEERRPKIERQYSSRSRSNTASKQSAPLGEAAGTGMGEDTWSPSRRVTFKPRKHPMTKKIIKYEWRPTLCQLNIIPCHKHRSHGDHGDWNRFWGESSWGSRDGYAPRHW